MFKIDSSGATVDNEFTEGNPQGGVPATVVSAEWLNAVQNEIVNILISRGITLDKTKSNQVSELLQRGVDFWHANLIYEKDSMCQIGGKIYISQLDGNINHNPATDDSTYWKAKIITDELFVTGNSTIETSTDPVQKKTYRNIIGTNGMVLGKDSYFGKTSAGDIFEAAAIE